MAKYNGIEFTPHREFTQKEKKMSLAQMDKHFGFAWDFNLGMYDSKDVHGHPQKIPYSHESFYSAMEKEGEGYADIYFCTTTGRYYIPCLHTMMEVRHNF